MAYVEGVFSGRRSKRGAILSLSLLAAASFAVGFIRNSRLDVAEPPPRTAVGLAAPVAIEPQPVLQAPTPEPPKPVAREAPRPAPVLDVPVQPAPPPAEAVIPETLAPPPPPAEPLKPAAGLPGNLRSF